MKPGATDADGSWSLVGSHFDGSTLMGFMSTVGLASILDNLAPGSRGTVSWRFEGRWLPTVSGVMGPDGIAAAVVDALRRTADLLESSFPTDSDLTIGRFRELFDRSHSLSATDYCTLDWLAAIGSDRVTRSTDGNELETTPFKSLGSGRQRFMPTLTEILRSPDEQAMDRCLRDRELALDGTLTLRWDPRDDRRHAHRWKDPSRDPIRSSSAMNALGVAALTLFPTAPRLDGLVANGFRRTRDGWEFTWPIWSPSIDSASIRHLVAHPELQAERPNRRLLRGIGVVDVFRVRRLVVERYVNFSPSWSP